MIHKAVFLAALVTAVVTSTPQSSKRRRSDISCLSQGNYYSDRHAAETHGQSILEQKSGKDDPECPWAVARLAQASQLRRQIQLGPGTRLDSEPIDLLPPIFLDGIAWWDEFHMKVRLGHASAWEVLLCRHPDSGDLVSEQEGGIWDAEAPTTSAKYPGEARVCVGAAMFTVALTHNLKHSYLETIRERVVLAYSLVRAAEAARRPSPSIDNVGGCSPFLCLFCASSPDIDPPDNGLRPFAVRLIS